jgi:metal-responsive CopG/Arc/MetJ family transcriptional regulator
MSRPKKILVKMRSRDWADLDDLVELTGAPSRSEAMRRAVRDERDRLRRERDEREAARLSAEAICEQIGRRAS